MRRLSRGLTAMAAMALMMTGAPALGTGAAVAEGGDGRVPLSPILRNCAHAVQNYYAPAGTASAYTVVNGTGGTVTADVTMATADRNTAYQVKLIQTPRAASSPCNPGGPGVTGGVVHTDHAGNGHITLTGERMSDATGAWVEISRPSPHSVVPFEYYSSDIVSRF